jgi:hypothetical protein
MVGCTPPAPWTRTRDSAVATACANYAVDPDEHDALLSGSDRDSLADIGRFCYYNFQSSDYPVTIDHPPPDVPTIDWPEHKPKDVHTAFISAVLHSDAFFGQPHTRHRIHRT